MKIYSSHQLCNLKTRLKDAAKEAGNVLFMILIAVALFAALSYAVTQSTRSGGGDATREQMKLQIGAIQQFSTSVRTSLMRMRVSGGYEFWQIDYSKTGYTSSLQNTNCTIASCALHNPQGGGISGALMPDAFLDPTNVGNATWKGKYLFRNIGIKGIGIDTQRDLVLLYPGVTKSLCMSVNDMSAVINSSGNPPVDAYNDDAGGGYVDYSGPLTAEVTLNSAPELGVNTPSIAGKQMFCSAQYGSGDYWLWVVLIER